MSKSSLVSVEIRGVRSIVGPHRIDFPKNGLVLIKGKNLDTGASSGSGKSSVLHAINYALGTGHIPSSRLENWNTPISVSLTVDVDGKNIVIERGQKTQITGDHHAKGASSVNEELEKLLGVSPSQLQSLTTRPQKKKSFFLSKSDEEKKSFLVEAIPLIGKFENLAIDSEARLAKLTTLVQLCETQLNQDLAVLNTVVVPEHQPLDTEATVAALAQIQSRIGELANKKVELQGCVDKIRSGVKESPQTELLMGQISKWEPLLAEASKKLAESEAKEWAAKSEYDKKARELENQIRQSKQSLEEKEGLLKRTSPALLSKITSLLDHKCPTCERPWDHAEGISKQVHSLKVELQALEEAVSKAKASLLDRESEKERVLPFSPSQEPEGLRVVKSQIEAQISEWRAELLKVGTDLMAEVMAESAEKQSQIDTLTEAIQGLTARASDLKFRIAEAESRYRTLENIRTQTIVAKDHLTQRADASRVKLQEAKKELDIESDFLQAVGRTGFLGAIFDEILIEISDEANDVLRHIPNTYGLQISIKSESVTQSGKTKKTISTAVTIDGHESNSKDGPSGGQESVLELAVDLAVSRVIRRRTGSSPAWMLLDEPFDGLGVVEKESFLEILKKSAQDMLIIVIDHATETQEMFDKVIDVQCKNSVSEIRG